MDNNCFGSMKVNNTKTTAVWNFNIDIYFKQ